MVSTSGFTGAGLSEVEEVGDQVEAEQQRLQDRDDGQADLESALRGGVRDRFDVCAGDEDGVEEVFDLIVAAEALRGMPT